MLVKSITATTVAALPAATPCGNCRAEERHFLHHVRHRGMFRRLCTTCVLRLHPQSFCPTCFQVYPPPPPNDAAFTCFKCYSTSHSCCVPAAATPYICPLCTQPNAPIFTPTSRENSRVLDLDAAKKLLAAARIASASMNKAAAAARAEAERRAKEAAFARKRAKEALEYVAHLAMKEKLRNLESAVVPGNNVGRAMSNQVNGLKENGKLGGGVAVGATNNDGGDSEVISDDDVDLVRALEEEMLHDEDEENSDGEEELVNGPNL